MRVKSSVQFLLMLAVVAGLSGCHKKAAVAPPPPPPPVVAEVAPPPPSVPTASLIAEPSTVTPGQAVTLKWSSTDASEAELSGVGSVLLEGTQEIHPEASTTYDLIVKGPGGTARASATVNVLAPLPPVVAPAPEPPSLLDRIAALSDAYFDYDKSSIREDARAILAKNAEALRSILADFPFAVVVLEGNCDERGSAEYNLGLGDRRAASVEEYLTALGIPADRLQTISYGKEKPACTESGEACWQMNRRVHFAAGPSPTN